MDVPCHTSIVNVPEREGHVAKALLACATWHMKRKRHCRSKELSEHPMELGGCLDTRAQQKKL